MIFLRTCWLILLVGACVAGEPKVSEEMAALLKSAEQAGDAKAAVTVLEAEIGDGANPAVWFALGTYLAEAGERAKAMAAYEQALAGMEDFGRARYNLAQLQMAGGEWQAAAGQLRLLLRDPAMDAGVVWVLLGQAYGAQGNLLAAEGAYRQGLAHGADREASVRGLAACLLDQGKLREAALLAQGEVNREPGESVWWSILVKADLAEGRRDDALARLVCMQRLGVANRDSLLLLGDLLAREGLATEALAVYEGSAALEKPPTARLLQAVELWVATGEWDEAEQLLGKLGASDDPEGQWLRARILQGKGAFAEAHAELLRLEAKRPTDALVLMALAEVEVELGRLDEAKLRLRRVGRLDEERRPEVLVRLARLAVREGELAQAISLLEQAQALRPQVMVERYLRRLRGVDRAR